MKLVLGGTQFGMNYGFYSRQKINKKEIKKIEKIALNSNIQFLDTAPTYGNSEYIIGNSGLRNLNLTTKFKFSNYTEQNEIVIERLVFKSLKKLKISQLYGLFIHDYRNLLGYKGKILLRTLNQLKKKKIIKKIGISIYEPSDLEKIWTFWKPDIVQFPFNVLDQRILRTNWLSKLKKNKVKIFARSCFLQGLLLVDPYSIKISLENRKSLLKFHNWCFKNKISKKQACIDFVKQNKKIDYLIIGFNNSLNLKESVNFFKKKSKIIPNIFSVNKTKIIDPRKWKKKF